MRLLSETLKAIVSDNRKALVTYIVAGDPNPSVTVSLMHRLVKSGADVIELGVPFSDPEAEGQVIQSAHERALVHDISLAKCIEMVADFRKTDSVTPVILMGYLNPFEAMGYEEFAEKSSLAGVNGTIIVNLPPEEAIELSAVMKKKGIEPVFLLAPTTTDERAKKICDASNGFVYYVSQKGTTGGSDIDIDDVSEKLERFKKLTSLPILVGFGIHDSATAKSVVKVADGAVVGSAIIKLMANCKDDLETLKSEVGRFVSELRSAID